MKKLIVFLLFPLSCFASTTRFVAAAGNDATGNGTQASPYQTPNKCASVSSSGDVCALNMGDTFAPLTATISGLSWNTYGSGARPLVSAFVTASGWTNQGGGIWSFTDSGLGSTVGIVTINGAVQPLGRFPKSGYNTIGSTGTNSITDASLSTNFNGGELVYRALHYALNRAAIASQSGSTVTFTANTNTNSYPPHANWGYFIQNHSACLTQFGDWYYNASTKTVYMYFGAASPTSYTIKVSKYDYACNLGNFDNNSFTGINFEGGNIATIYGSGLGHTFNNWGVLSSGGDGIQLTGSTGFTITNGQVKNCNNNGIIIPYAANSTINNCSVKNTGIIPGAGGSGNGTTGYGNYQGFVLGQSNPASSYNNVMQYDTVTNVGYNAFKIDGDTFTGSYLIANGYCLIVDDGGAFYTYNGLSNYTYTTRTFQYCQSSGGGDATLGTGDGYNQNTHGFYADDNTNHLTVSNLTSQGNNGGGAFIHNSRNVTIQNFNFLNNYYGINIQHDSDGASAVSAITIQNGTIVPTGTQLAYRFYSPTSSDVSSIGTMSGNTYYNLYNNINLFQNNGTNGTLASWQSATGTDGTSTLATPVSGFGEPKTVLVTQSGNSTINWLDANKTLHLKGSYISVPAGGSVLQFNVGGVVLR